MERINLIAEKTREELRDALSFLKKDEIPFYKVTRTDCDTYIELSVTPTDSNVAYITSTALDIVLKVYQSSEWKSSMFYGIVVKYDETIKENIPSLSICIKR